MKNRLKISRIAVVLIILALLVSGSLFVSGCIEGTNGEQSEEAGSDIPNNEQQEQVQEQENDTGNGLEITDDFHVKNLPEPVNLEELFNAEEAAYRTEQIFDALKSFRLLTEKAEGKISKEEMDALGNTGWETQYLGFHNWTNTVLGTILRQDYEIKKLELELAAEKLEAGKIAKEELELKEAEYIEAKNKFQEFLDSYAIAD